jgi:broad specificity phosphatase PhoE
VRRRGLDVIEKLERQFDNEVILLVSHGDMLQILLTAFFEIPAEQHRSLPHHKQAEIKSLMVNGQEFSTRLQVL